ncbi:MAG: hypothetical protein IMZ54_11765 [Acidobacteria bacterium]|nr:hypothetical protein [Acidobacteriota bacterium]
MEQIQKLTKIQAALLRSIKTRHDQALNAELSAALMDIVEEVGLAEDVEAGKVGVRVTPDMGSIIVTRPDEPKEEKKTE